MPRIPRRLMVHRIDLHTSTITQDAAGGISKVYTLSTASIPCNFQPATSEVVEQYERHDEVVSASVFLIDQTAYDATTVKDRIIFNSINYEVVGKQNLSNLNRVYRVDLKEEIL